MAYELMDISKMADPLINCDDYLMVNRNRKGIFTAYLVFLFVSLVGIGFLMIIGLVKAGISILMIVMPVLGLVFYRFYSEQNPVLVIDKNGITLEQKFYPWNIIESVKCEKWQSRKGYIHILICLKNRKIIRVTINELFDQPGKVIATYINRYFKQDHS